MVWMCRYSCGDRHLCGWCSWHSASSACNMLTSHSVLLMTFHISTTPLSPSWFYLSYFYFLPSLLWHCCLGGRKGIWPVKSDTEWWCAGMVVCLERGADLHMAQLMPLPLTVSCFSKIQTGLRCWCLSLLLSANDVWCCVSVSAFLSV